MLVWVLKDYWGSVEDLQKQIDKLDEVILASPNSPDRDMLLKQYGAFEESYKDFTKSVETLLDEIDNNIRI